MILLVVPFCAHDADRALDLLEWCGQLGRQDHPALLVTDPAVDWQIGLKALSLARKAFANAQLVAIEQSITGWIPGSVALFSLAARTAQERGLPFLFLEPDAVPLKADWLEQLDAAYRRELKLFLGPVISHGQNGLPSPYMEGVAIYPANAWRLMEPLLRQDQSWTFTCASVVVPLATNTPLIKHVWGQKGNPPTFGQWNVPGSSLFSLQNIPPETVIWHRCKDSTLITLLRQRLGLVPAAKRPQTKPLRVVSLRRAGDIIALLPALEHFHRKGQNVQLVVHTEFLPLLEGVSYVQPLEWKGDWEDPLTAAKKFGAINAQVYGKGVPRPTRLQNFVGAAWKQLKLDWNRYLPLTFDRRDLQREQILAKRVFQTDKPKILVKCHGFSSPFPHGPLLKKMLVEQFGEQAEVVDLDGVKAHRLYDLLGLLDRAACLVSTDTVTLHLIRGHRIPTVALVNDSLWGASPRLGNVICRLPYREALPKWQTEAAPMIREALRRPPNNDVVLVYSDWTAPELAVRQRQQQAQSTWSKLEAKRLLAYRGGRDSEAVGDPNHLPFFRDMVNQAATTGPENIIALVNNDIVFDPALGAAVRQSCARYGCYWAYRLDQPGGRTDNGVDLVAFTRQWWALHQALYPDFLMACWCWDDVLQRIMDWSGCREQARLYYHTPHQSIIATRAKSPAFIYNDRLYRQWLQTQGEPDTKPIDLLAAL